MALERLMCPLEKLCAQHVPLTGPFGVTCALADNIVNVMDVDGRGKKDKDALADSRCVKILGVALHNYSWTSKKSSKA